MEASGTDVGAGMTVGSVGKDSHAKAIGTVSLSPRFGAPGALLGVGRAVADPAHNARFVIGASAGYNYLMRGASVGPYLVARARGRTFAIAGVQFGADRPVLRVGAALGRASPTSRVTLTPFGSQWSCRVRSDSSGAPVQRSVPLQDASARDLDP